MNGRRANSLLLLVMCAPLAGCGGASSRPTTAPVVPQYFLTTYVLEEGNLTSTNPAPYSAPVQIYDPDGRISLVVLTFSPTRTIPSDAPTGAARAWIMSSASGSNSPVPIYFDSKGQELNFETLFSFPTADGTLQQVRIAFAFDNKPEASNVFQHISYLSAPTRNAAFGGNLTTDAALADPATYFRSIKIYDGTDQRLAITFQFTRDTMRPSTSPPGTSTSWSYVATSSDGPVVGSGELYYDANGINIPEPVVLTFKNSNGAIQTIANDFSKTTTLSGQSTLAPTSVDGGPFTSIFRP